MTKPVPQYIGNAGYVANSNGGYTVFARWNEKAKFKTIGVCPVGAQAKLWAEQLDADGTQRHAELRDTKDWDFIANEPAQKKTRKPREERGSREPSYSFSFDT